MATASYLSISPFDAAISQAVARIMQEVPTFPWVQAEDTEKSFKWIKSTLAYDEWLKRVDEATACIPDPPRTEITGLHLNASSMIWYGQWRHRALATGMFSWETFCEAFEAEHRIPRTFERALDIVLLQPHVTTQESADEYLKRVRREFRMVPWEKHEQTEILFPRYFEEHAIKAVVRNMKIGHPVRRARGITTWKLFEAEVMKATTRPDKPGGLTSEKQQMKLGHRDKPMVVVRDVTLGNRVIPATTWQEFRNDTGNETIQEVVEKDGVAALTEMFERWTLMVQIGSSMPAIKNTMARLAKEIELRREPYSVQSESRKPRTQQNGHGRDPCRFVCTYCNEPVHIMQRRPETQCYTYHDYGHVVGGDRIAMMSKKVQRILTFRRPTDAKAVQSFLRLTDYYKRFIPMYAERARPLSAVIRKDVPFEFGPEQEEAMDDLQDAIVTAPVLKDPDFSQDWSLTCDASNYSIGAMLGQRDDDGILHPVYYYSRELCDEELYYPMTFREVLAVVDAIYKFRLYLSGCKTTVYTDRDSTGWLMNSNDLTGKLERCQSILSEFDLIIKPKSDLK